LFFICQSMQLTFITYKTAILRVKTCFSCRF
jgi:hypothetical protein